MQKKGLKYLLVIAALAGGTMIFLYAQKGYFFRQSTPAAASDKVTDDREDDIGTLTDDNPWKEMDKLVTAYYSEQGSSFKGTVKLIDDNGDKEKVIEEHPFEYAVLKDNFYYSLDKIDVVQKKNMVLVADHTNRLVSVSYPAAGSRDEKQKLFDIGEFKKIMKERKAEAKVTQLGDEKILTIENIEDPQIQGYRIYYNPQTYKVSKMLIGMVRLTSLDDGEENKTEDAPSDNITGKTDDNSETEEESADPDIETYTYYLEIIYKESTVLGVTEETFHPENKFILINNNKTELTKPYSNYQLIVNSKEPEQQQEQTKDNSEEQ